MFNAKEIEHRSAGSAMCSEIIHKNLLYWWFQIPKLQLARSSSVGYGANLPQYTGGRTCSNRTHRNARRGRTVDATVPTLLHLSGLDRRFISRYRNHVSTLLRSIIFFPIPTPPKGVYFNRAILIAVLRNDFHPWILTNSIEMASFAVTLFVVLADVELIIYFVHGTF